MPISGFRRGDAVLTPAGKRARVSFTRRVDGREQVNVRLVDSYVREERTFDASALRLVKREEKI